MPPPNPVAWLVTTLLSISVNRVAPTPTFESSKKIPPPSMSRIPAVGAAAFPESIMGEPGVSPGRETGQR